VVVPEQHHRPLGLDDPVEAMERLLPVHPVEGSPDRHQAERPKARPELAR
jgi:hypothetical protein